MDNRGNILTKKILRTVKTAAISLEFIRKILFVLSTFVYYCKIVQSY